MFDFKKIQKYKLTHFNYLEVAINICFITFANNRKNAFKNIFLTLNFSAMSTSSNFRWAAFMVMVAGVLGSAASPPASALSPLPNRQKAIHSVQSSARVNQPSQKSRAKILKAGKQGMPEIFGAVCSSATLTPGMYSIPTSEDEEFSQLKMETSSQNVNASDGGVRVGNYYYALYSEELIPGWSLVYISSWDISDYGWIRRWETEGESNLMATDFAVDPVSGTVYGSLNNDNGGYELCTVEFPMYKTKPVTRNVIGALESPLYAAAFDNSGTLYALEADGDFVTIDKSSGNSTVVGATGLSLSGKGSGVIDPTTERFFCSVSLSDGTSGLYEIATSTGAATLINTFSGNETVTGLYCNASETVAAAPGKPSGLSADFPQGALEGTFTFTVPDTDAAGNPGSGQLSYSITSAGTTLATGTTEFGATEVVSVTLPAEGEHEISVVVSNDNGVSEPASIKVRAGKGLPKSPVVSASWTDGKMIVSWPPVTESADGGYVDPQEITYTVTRYPGQVVIANNTKETVIDDIFEMPDKFTIYHYSVEASYGDKISAAGISPNVAVGAYSVPYTQDFGASFYADDMITTFTIIDANEDGQGWAYNSYTEVMRCRTMSGPADDWLILPAIHMEAGMVYELSAQLKDGGETLQEEFEVKFGLQNRVEDMTFTIIERQYVESSELKEYKAYIRPDQTGDWYIGFHCTTPQEAYYLYLDNISVTAKASAGLPQAPSNMTVLPDESGQHLAQITFNAPSEDVSGSALMSLEKIVIMRDGEEIHTIANPVPGQACEFTDTDIPAGEHEWTAVAYNDCGCGDAALFTAFVGIHKPAATEWATASETDVNGVVKVEWAQVSTDENGKAIPEDKITYSVVRVFEDSTQEIIEENLTTTSLTFTAIGEGEQDFMNFAVFAHTEGGYSKGFIAPQIIVGTPAEMPYRESFMNSGLSSPFSVATVNGYGMWQIVADDTFADMKSHDGDNGYLAMAASGEGDSASLTSGKISLKDAKNPTLTFYVFNMDGDWGMDDNIVEVQVGTDGVFESVYNKPNYESGTANCWNRVTISLAKFAGKDIQLRFIATCRHASYTLIDEIGVQSFLDYDTRAVNLNTPVRVVANEPVTLVAEVENMGINTAENVAVVIYADGCAYMRKDIGDLKFGEGKFVKFDCVINPSFGESVELKAKVDANSDSYPDNDYTETYNVSIEQSLLPAPSMLKADEVQSDYITLSWDAPDLTQAVPARVLEDFEAAEEWTSKVGDWTFVDLDHGLINGFDGVTFPNIPEYSEQSFWVMDDRLECLNNTFAAFSGHKYLANMNVVEAENTDDWAISPMLCGKQQTISFRAKSYNWIYPETFELLVSSDGSDPSDFTLLEEFTEVPWEWTEYAAVLPEDTRYFAIRSNFDNGVMLFVDNVSFVPDGEPEALELQGYNVYCDGIVENQAPIKEQTYTVRGHQSDKHIYVVTAVYDKGESAPSDKVTTLDVESVVADNVNIYSVKGGIVVDGADGKLVTVCSVDGKSLFSQRSHSTQTHISLTPAIYIVKVGTTVRKLVVK